MMDQFLLLLLASVEDAEEEQLIIELYEKHQKPLCRYLVRQFHMSEEDAEDCVQQTYLNLIRHVKKVMTLDLTHRTAYVLRSAQSVAVNFVKKKKRATFVDLEKDAMDNVLYSQENQSFPCAEEIVENREILRIFNERLCELSVKERMVYQLFFIENLSREELAKRLGVSVDSVRTYISRTRNHAEKILEEIRQGR